MRLCCIIHFTEARRARWERGVERGRSVERESRATGRAQKEKKETETSSGKRIESLNLEMELPSSVFYFVRLQVIKAFFLSSDS